MILISPRPRRRQFPLRHRPAEEYIRGGASAFLPRLRNIEYSADIFRFLQDIRQLNRPAGIQDQDQRDLKPVKV